MAQDAVLRDSGGVFACATDQLASAQCFQGDLHRAFGKPGSFRNQAQAGGDRPYKAWGYPVVPALFVLGLGVLVVNTVVEKPMESLVGVFLVALGLPTYLYWRRERGRV